MKYLLKNLLIVFLIFLIISGIFTLLTTPMEKVEQISLNQLVDQINQEKVKRIVVKDNQLEIELKDGRRAKAQKEKEASLTESLKNYGVDSKKLKLVNLEIKPESGWALWLGAILPFLLPFLIIGLFLWFMLKGARQGQMQAFSFGRSRARLFTPENQKEKVTFNDVAGLKEAKEELKEIVEFLKNPKKFTELGAKIPKGVLLIGAPGTGKTLLARAVANEAGVPFFHVSGSEFQELFVGIGASCSSDTNVLIRTNSSTKMMKIGEFVDQFYKENEGGFEVPIKDTWTLGANWTRGNKFFKSSSWKKVRAVYRHKVNKIYEIHFIGGKIKVTGDHSIFVRNCNHIISKKVSQLKVGDVLIDLPDRARGKYNPELPLYHRPPDYAKAHQFPEELSIKELVIWPSDDQKDNYDSASIHFIPPSIAQILGLSTSQAAGLKTLTNRLSQNPIYKVKVTPALMKLMGYYTAQGDYHSRNLRFSFGRQEKEIHKDCIKLVRQIFNLEPNLYYTKNNALMIQFVSSPIGQFFIDHCGQGACNKHIPELLWDLPREYFISYLEGLVAGNGDINQRKMIEFSSCSEQLISELRWLLNMHGIPCSITKYKKPAGRIKNGKPWPASTYWRITIARRVNPLSPIFFKRPIIKKIEVKPYNGYVYDLCGCENEAFFGGEKPILLHNSRVRDLFQTAKKHSPAIIFIDEIDSIGRQRGFGLTGAHEEREQTLNQILSEMDGFEPNSGLIILGATNRPDILDIALLRPGRFDRRIILDEPDIQDREDILKIHTRNKHLASGVNLREIAERTPGFSGADLANLVNEAALLAARRDKKEIGQDELRECIEKVLLGPERKSHLLSKREKEIAAYHEAGHALVNASLPHTDPIHKVSIISRGRAAGYTLKLPVEDRHLRTRSEFLDELAVLLGGYAAEELVFHELTTGAASDLRMASDLARKLVTQYGMSEKLGPVAFGPGQELVFWGREIATEKNYSEAVAAQIDQEVAKFIDQAYQTAKKILIEKRAKLEKIAKHLIKKETIERKEFERIIGKRPKRGGANSNWPPKRNPQPSKI